MNQRALTSSPTPRWLTLSQAAQFLGVHATTLRRWADDGEIRCLRTPGGHRRFLDEDLHGFVAAQLELDQRGPPQELERALVLEARRAMQSRSRAETSWRTAFDEAERASRRASGRRLVGLAIQFTSRSSGREAILHEGRRIGRQYGRDAAERGLSLVDTTRAFLFFREALIRSARPGLVSRGQYDAEDVHIHRSLREFLDQVFFAAMAAYQECLGPSLARPGGVE
jgi:excisionase family DNA binding protein